MKKLKILMLNYEFPPLGGGAANANFYLLKEFSKVKNLEIDLITSSANNKYEEEQFSKNIRIFKLDVHKKDLQFWKMKEILSWSMQAYNLSKKLIKHNNYGLCHCWFGWPSGIIGYLNRKELPYIVALRGSDVPGYNVRLEKLDTIVFKPISKKVWSNAKSVIANSLGLKELAQKTLDCDIKVIYNGIDTNEFKPAKKKKSSTIRLISTGRLIKRKGYGYLIKALSGLEGFSLSLIGDGDEKENLKELAKEMKVKVNFKGTLIHKKIVKELQQADIFVLPSLNEGMSNSILEAMATGLPIITTDVGGSKELIKENGFIIQKANIKELKEALLKYKNNLKLLLKHSKQSTKKAKTMSWKTIGKQYEGIYFEN
ncbi:MAG: glycosyltransferase family 4 protein [archaeon]